MIYTIENDTLRVSVHATGAQLWSVYSKKTNTEYLWQGDPAYWAGRAYNLFPFIGRMYKNTYTFEGKEYTSRTHGVARYNLFQVESRSATRITLLLKDNEDTLEEYPFHFAYRVTFSLENNTLTVRQEVTNTDDKTLICAFGGHPGINVPFDEGTFEDYYLEFSDKTNTQRHYFSETTPLMAGISNPYALEKGKKLPLKHSLFDVDAVVLSNTSRKVAYKSDTTPRSVVVDFTDFKYIGFWHPSKTNAPFVCFEPWTALPATEGKQDALETKADMTQVPVGKKASVAYSLTINE